MITFIALLITKINHKTTLIMSTNLVEIFYLVDEFCKEIEKTVEGHFITQANVNDRKPLNDSIFHEKLFERLFRRVFRAT